MRTSLRSFRSLLPLVVSLGALATQACAAPSGDEPRDPSLAQSGDASESPAEDGPSALAGSAGEVSESGVAPVLGALGDASASAFASDPSVVAQLQIASRKATYDVLAYDLGIEAGEAQLAGVKGIVAGKASLRPLSVVIRPKAGAPSLAKDVFVGKPLGDVTLMGRGAGGAWVPVANLEGTLVESAATSVGGNVPVEQYAIAMRAVTVRSGAAWVKFDAALAQATCSDACPCGDTHDAKLGPYVQATDPGFAPPKGSVRVDQVSVSVSNASGKAALDGIALSAPYETSGMCAFFDAARGAIAPSIAVGVAGPAGTKEESISWEACAANVKSVTLSSSYDGAYESVVLGAAGLLRTDRSFDGNGKVQGTSSSGWSFADNAIAASCADVGAK